MTDGVALTRPEPLVLSRLLGLGEAMILSSFSVRTARSPGFKFEETANDTRLLPPGLSLIDPPAILEKVYVENRFEARRSRTSFFFRAANEFSIAGACVSESSREEGAGGD